MKKIITGILPFWLKEFLVILCAKIFDIYAIKSYSQEGEDMVLNRIFEGKERGYYVDVGAHRPWRFSNTYFFYRRGWSGINIEPNPDSERTFHSARPRDINLQIGVSDCARQLTYYLFDDPALNTFDADIVKSRLATTPYKLVKTIDVPVQRLDAILKKYLPVGQIIDFLSVDVEGLDFVVLQSNDWQLFRPKYVLAEALGMSLKDVMRGDIFLFMESQGYALFAKTYNTLIFSDQKT